MKHDVGRPRTRVWLFDLDNTLHDASHAAFGHTSVATVSAVGVSRAAPQLNASSASAAVTTPR